MIRLSRIRISTGLAPWIRIRTETYAESRHKINEDQKYRYQAIEITVLNILSCVGPALSR
jgi:hypothetical protein